MFPGAIAWLLDTVPYAGYPARVRGTRYCRIALSRADAANDCEEQQGEGR